MMHHLPRHPSPHTARRAEIEQQNKKAQPERNRIVRGGGGSIAQLHRTVGNRAVARMVSDQPADPNVIQRYPVLHKPGNVKELTTTAEIKIAETADEVDKEVDAAYKKFMGGDFDGANQNHVNLYNLRMYQFQNGEKSMHPSTAAGYVIESMVNKAIEKKPGVKLQDTGLLEGTRPDVVIDHGAGIVGMLDITASNSAGHILSKKGDWLSHKNIPLVMESLYPSKKRRGGRRNISLKCRTACISG
jgi:hypothetical protein